MLGQQIKEQLLSEGEHRLLFLVMGFVHIVCRPALKRMTSKGRLATTETGTTDDLLAPVARLDRKQQCACAREAAVDDATDGVDMVSAPGIV